MTAINRYPEAFPPVQLQDGASPEWTCQSCGGDGLFCKCKREPVAAAHREQQMPVKNDGPCIQDLVISDIEKRKAIGLQRYGTLLQPFNGRDALRDLYEELLDAAQYIRQEIEERDRKLAATPAPDFKNSEGI